MAKMLRIVSKRDGFRRCGVAHPISAVDHPLDRFTKAELAELQAEPTLYVHEVDVKAEKEEPDGEGGGAPDDPKRAKGKKS